VHQQQQMAAAAEVAREQQDVMMRQAAPGSGGAVMPHDAVALHEGGFGLFQQQPASQAQTAVALTYQMESSPPPSSSIQSPLEEVSYQQHADGSGGGA
jgi:hypothetical protein